MRELKLTIFGLQVHCRCEDQVYDHLSKDFEFFLNNASQVIKPFMNLTVYLKSPPYEKLEGLICQKQSANSMTFQRGDQVYNDYYGKALTIMNLDKNQGEVYSTDLNRLCEITYLLILSRTGKRMDLEGFHKIHAFGVNNQGISFVCMMPSKGGKTTLFLDLIKMNPEFKIISDDTPVLDGRGNIHSFPLRVGVEEDSPFSKEYNENVYFLERELWGKKKLIPLSTLKRKVADVSDRVILLTGVRRHDKKCTLVERTSVQAFKDLQKHMTVGLGLPMIIEYFLELNIKDFFRLSYIFFSRLFASIILVSKCRHYTILLGTDTGENAKVLSRFIKEKS